MPQRAPRKAELSNQCKGEARSHPAPPLSVTSHGDHRAQGHWGVSCFMSTSGCRLENTGCYSRSFVPVETARAPSTPNYRGKAPTWGRESPPRGTSGTSRQPLALSRACPVPSEGRSGAGGRFTCSRNGVGRSRSWPFPGLSLGAGLLMALRFGVTSEVQDPALGTRGWEGSGRRGTVTEGCYWAGAGRPGAGQEVGGEGFGC